MVFEKSFVIKYPCKNISNNHSYPKTIQNDCYFVIKMIK